MIENFLKRFINSGGFTSLGARSVKIFWKPLYVHKYTGLGSKPNAPPLHVNHLN